MLEDGLSKLKRFQDTSLEVAPDLGGEESDQFKDRLIIDVQEPHNIRHARGVHRAQNYCAVCVFVQKFNNVFTDPSSKIRAAEDFQHVGCFSLAIHVSFSNLTSRN